MATSASNTTSTSVVGTSADYLAVRVYRSVGFCDTEVLLAAERRPV